MKIDNFGTYLIFHNTGQEYLLETITANIIGRGIDGKSDVATIVLPHPSISRKHASVTFNKKMHRWVFENISSNPSNVNGVPIKSEKDLKHGDEINIGPFSFSFFEKSCSLEDTMELPMIKGNQKASFASEWQDKEATPLGSIIEIVVMVFFILLSVFIFFCCFVW